VVRRSAAIPDATRYFLTDSARAIDSFCSVFQNQYYLYINHFQIGVGFLAMNSTTSFINSLPATSFSLAEPAAKFVPSIRTACLP